MAATSTSTANPPWWLDDGWETCTVCLETYAYEVEVRCADCDEAVCPHCTAVVHRERRVVCAPCGAGAGTADPTRGGG